MKAFSQEEEDFIKKVDAFADKAHAGHTHSNKANKPYIGHLRETAALVRESGGSVDEICAALLHDSVEDTEVTVEEIERNFNEHIAHLVSELTDPPGASKLPTLERKTNQAERVKQESDEVKRIKLSDQLSNVGIVTHDPPVSWSLQKCKDYIEGARRISVACTGVSDYLDTKFKEAYEKALLAYPYS